MHLADGRFPTSGNEKISELGFRSEKQITNWRFSAEAFCRGEGVIRLHVMSMLCICSDTSSDHARAKELFSACLASVLCALDKQTGLCRSDVLVQMAKC